MGFWPFGRDEGDVEFVTRVVTALTFDNVKLRGKLTVHFAEPRARGAADASADACAFLMSQMLSEASDHRALLGDEERIVARFQKGLPEDFAELRGIELVALHVVGDMNAGGAVRRPTFRGIRAVAPRSDAGGPPLARRPVESARPKPPPAPAESPRNPAPQVARRPAAPLDLKLPAVNRPAPSRKDSLKVRLPGDTPHPGPPRVAPQQPAAIAPQRPLQRAPTPRPAPPRRRSEPAAKVDAAPARVDPPSPSPRSPSRRTPPQSERAPTPPPSRKAPGAGGASRRPATPPPVAPAPLPARRVGTWRRTLDHIQEGSGADDLAGPIAQLLRDAAARIYLSAALAFDHDGFELMEAFEPAAADAVASDTRIAMERLRREASACAAYLFYASLLEIGIPQNIAIETLQAAWVGSLPGKMPIAELTRYLSAKQTAREISFAAVLILGSDQDPAEIRAVMEPLLAALGPEVALAAKVVKRATGL